MSINALKQKLEKICVKNSFAEITMTAIIGILMLIQRFLTGGYKPVMDDWFLYGDVYKNAARLKYFAVPNEKFAIRPFAGMADCFINAPLFRHLWLVELILTISLLVGVFLIIRTLRRNGFTGGAVTMCILCLFPAMLEATYWIAAATRVAYSMLFIGMAITALDIFFKQKRKGAFIAFSVFGLLSVGFYEPAIVIYIVAVMFIVWANYKDKKSLLPLAVMALHVLIIGIYYILNSGAGEIESRGGFVESDFIEHTKIIFGYIKDIFTTHTLNLLRHGLNTGLDVIGGYKSLPYAVISVISLLFGISAAFCIRKRKFSVKVFTAGIAFFIGGIALNFILGSERIPVRLVYFSYLGVGIIFEELLSLLPLQINRILIAFFAVFLSLNSVIVGIGEVSDYQKTSDYDTYITQQIIDLDTKERITDVNKNTYVFGGQHYYYDLDCIKYHDHIRGASGNYAELTGCMQHLTNVAFTNSLVTFTYGDTHIMEPYIHQEGVCHFYNIEFDKTVVKADIIPDGNNFTVVREDGSVIGTLIKTDDVSYQFFN